MYLFFLMNYSIELTQLEGTEHIWSPSIIVCGEKRRTENRRVLNYFETAVLLGKTPHSSESSVSVVGLGK